jgi:hypothetical protein
MTWTYIYLYKACRMLRYLPDDVMTNVRGFLCFVAVGKQAFPALMEDLTARQLPQDYPDVEEAVEDNLPL